MVELTIILAVAVLVVVAVAIWQRWWEFLIPSRYMKMDPPPDVDKATHGHVGTDTCWQATAANMLA